MSDRGEIPSSNEIRGIQCILLALEALVPNDRATARSQEVA